MMFVLIILVTSVWASPNCQDMSSLASLQDDNTIVETNLEMLAGTWISEGCETRPGPEYVLRSYTFEENGKFFLIQHRYWDDSCSSPQLSMQTYGRIQLRTSIVQPGAASSNLKIFNITVIPQDDNAANELDEQVSSECPGQAWKSWKKYEEHTVYDSRYDENKRKFNLWFSQHNSPYAVNGRGSNVHFSDISCLGPLKWAFNELKLIKVQLRPLMDQLMQKNTRDVKMELLLGDIHSNPRLRQYYNPTSFQVPLVKHVKEPSQIKLNRHTFNLKNSQALPQNIFTNSKTPPHLIEKPQLPPYIWGQWISSRCESRPGGILYLTRSFSFYPEDASWIGEHNFYSDPFCRISKFILTAAGHFKLQGLNNNLKRTSNIDFQIERATLTVLDPKMINDPRLIGHCGLGNWEVNIPKELSPTRGCINLGFVLPSMQYDVLKLEMDYKGSCLLFFGQVDSEDVQLNDPEKRPTAFQLPLVKCGEVGGYSHKLWQILNEDFNADTGGSSLLCLPSFLIISVFMFLCTFVR